jgi:hypothetical protein
MKTSREALAPIVEALDPVAVERIGTAVDRIVEAKRRGGKVVVVTGSGPNVHEGVTTLLAELLRVGLVDGITTSSAVVSHEMGGTLDRVKRCAGAPLGLPSAILPKGGEFELTEVSSESMAEIRESFPLDNELLAHLQWAEGKTIIKAAGNLGYPLGLWLEHLATEIELLARTHGLTFEEVAGLGADERTMIGIGARIGRPVLVTIPQLIGGGQVGLSIGDSIPLAQRAARLARMLSEADVIIESGVALTQEIHDGPLETYTGHGLWAAWQGHSTYSLQGKSLIRIDLDPALEKVWCIEREGAAVQGAIADGLPKTKLFKVPFRMEMSGFARHEGSLAIIGDLGAVWPVLADQAAARLGFELGFMSYPQQTEAGRAMREWIVREVRPFSRRKMLEELRVRL